MTRALAFFLFALILFPAAAFALESAVNVSTPPAIRANFNLGAPASAFDQSYPQGKNAEAPPTETLAQELSKPNDFICFGQNCTCESVRPKNKK